MKSKSDLIYGKPKFCSICGEKLITKKIFGHYDNYTSKRVFRIDVNCPNNKWYNHHMSYSINELGIMQSASWWDG